MSAGAWSAIGGWCAVLVTLGVSISSVGLGGEPEEFFVGEGDTFTTGTCGASHAILTVANTSAGWIATLADDHCLDTYTYQLAMGGVVYLLEGNWSEGFYGQGGLSWIEIGPYGNGTAIEFVACFGCYQGAPSMIYWIVGEVADTRLLP